MLERTKRIPFRISSLSSKVEPEPGAGPSYRLRLRNTGWNDLVPWPAWAWSWTWSAWCRRYTWCWQRRRRSSRPRSSCTTWYAASASTSRISFLARSWRNERIRKKDYPYLWTFNIKVTKLPVMNVSFRLNSFLNRFFVNNFKANQCWNSHPKRSIFYFLPQPPRGSKLEDLPLLVRRMERIILLVCSSRRRSCSSTILLWNKTIRTRTNHNSIV